MVQGGRERGGDGAFEESFTLDRQIVVAVQGVPYTKEDCVAMKNRRDIREMESRCFYVFQWNYLSSPACSNPFSLYPLSIKE